MYLFRLANLHYFLGVQVGAPLPTYNCSVMVKLKFSLYPVISGFSTQCKKIRQVQPSLIAVISLSLSDASKVRITFASITLPVLSNVSCMSTEPIGEKDICFRLASIPIGKNFPAQILLVCYPTNDRRKRIKCKSPEYFLRCRVHRLYINTV